MHLNRYLFAALIFVACQNPPTTSNIIAESATSHNSSYAKPSYEPRASDSINVFALNRSKVGALAVVPFYRKHHLKADTLLITDQPQNSVSKALMSINPVASIERGVKEFPNTTTAYAITVGRKKLMKMEIKKISDFIREKNLLD